MEPKLRLNSASVVLFVVIVGVWLWWFMRTPAVVPERTAAATMPAKADLPKTVAPPAQVEMPKAPAVPAGGETVVAHADSQAELNSDLADIARMLRAGDTVGFRMTYTPPEKLTPEFVQKLKSDLGSSNQGVALKQYLQQISEGAAESYEALENQTPTFNATGDEATYMYTLPPPPGSNSAGVAVPRTFVKINGKWYLE